MSINGIVYRESSSFKLLIACLLIIGYIITDGIMALDIENNKRAQSFRNLNQFEYCFKKLDPYMERKQSFDACASKMSTTFTGDVYILDPNTLEFIFDASRDAGKEKPAYFTEDSVGKYFSDWKSGEDALKVMLLGKDSIAGTRVSYRFDDADEWIEWIYIQDRRGEFIVVQGAQSDEATARFSGSRYTMRIGVIVLVLLILVNVGFNNRKMKLDE